MAVASNENVPVESYSLSAQVAAALSKHPMLYYSAHLENSHIPAHRDMQSFFGDPFPIPLMPITLLYLIRFAR